MRLLVSVRSPEEVAPALTGGADIVDAKEPARGSLGPVAPEVLRGIAAALAPGVPLSVALGDVGTPTGVGHALEPFRWAPARYLKLGFAGTRSLAAVEAALAAAVELAASFPHRPRLIAVAYADADRAASLPAETVTRLAAERGAAGVLLDTWLKDGGDLFAWISPAWLRSWVADVRALGLESAVAGSLRVGQLREVVEADPDVVGVRGAACEGGRGGRVSPELVAALRQELYRELTVRQPVTDSVLVDSSGSFEATPPRL